MLDEQQEAPQKTESEVRRDRYMTNLMRVERLQPADFLPSEVQARTWQEVVDPEEVSVFMANFPSYGGKALTIDRRLTGVYKNVDSGLMFASPALPDLPVTRQIVLDMLAGAKDLAPWAPMAGLKVDGKQEFFNPETPGTYTFHGRWVVIFPPILENIINGLGDEKYTDTQRQELIIEVVSCIVHETVHQNNNPDLDFGGPHRILAEIASTVTEYLVFPGRNDKISKLIDQSDSLLMSHIESSDEYAEALLIGMLLCANHTGFLPPEDDKNLLRDGLSRWRAYVESLSRVELENIRRGFESALLLSEQDAKLLPGLRILLQKYPQALSHLKIGSLESLSPLVVAQQATGI